MSGVIVKFCTLEISLNRDASVVSVVVWTSEAFGAAALAALAAVLAALAAALAASAAAFAAASGGSSIPGGSSAGAGSGFAGVVTGGKGISADFQPFLGWSPRFRAAATFSTVVIPQFMRVAISSGCVPSWSI